MVSIDEIVAHLRALGWDGEIVQEPRFSEGFQWRFISDSAILYLKVSYSERFSTLELKMMDRSKDPDRTMQFVKIKIDLPILSGNSIKIHVFKRYLDRMSQRLIELIAKVDAMPKKGDRFLHFKGISYSIEDVSNTFSKSVFGKECNDRYLATNTENGKSIEVYRCHSDILCVCEGLVVTEPMVIYAPSIGSLGGDTKFWARPLDNFASTASVQRFTKLKADQ